MSNNQVSSKQGHLDSPQTHNEEMSVEYNSDQRNLTPL